MNKITTVLLFTLLTASAASAQATPTLASQYKFDIDGSVGSKVTLTLPDDGSIVISLLRLVPEPVSGRRLTLALTPFRNESNALVEAKLVEPADPAALAGDATESRIRIMLPANLPAGKYVGGLVVSAPNVEPMFQKLELVRPAVAARPALIAGQQSLAMDVTSSFEIGRWKLLGQGSTAVYYVPLRLKDGSRPPAGTYCLHEQAPKAPEGRSDPKRGIDIKIQDGSGADETKAIITVSGLGPGEYVYYLRFALPGGTPDDLQKVTVTVRVRHSVGWAIIAILLGFTLSFLSTKYVSFLRNRAELTEKILSLQRCWGAGAHSTVPPCLAVAWSRSMLEQTRDQANFFSFAPIEKLKRRLDAVERVVRVLDKIESLLIQIKLLPRLHGYRARGQVVEFLQTLDPHTVNETTESQISTQIDALRHWVNGDQKYGVYWTDVREKYKALVADIQRNKPSPLHSSLQEFIMELPAGTPGQDATIPNHEQIKQYDESYCRLKLLWDFRQWPEPFDKLITYARQSPSPSLDSFFEYADDLGWNLLYNACAQEHVEVEANVLSGAGALEAYEPILFTFSTHTRTLHGSYLVQQGCTYRWFIQRTGTTQRFWSFGFLKPWTRICPPVETSAPLLVDYPVGDGRLSVQLEITRHGEHTKPIKLDVGDVKPSEGLRAFFITGSADKLSYIVAGALALVGGLATYYFRNPTFGSVQDYISLVLLAAGVDQSKNALQLVQNWKPGPAETTSSTAPASAAAAASR